MAIPTSTGLLRFGREVRRTRERAGVSQAEMARISYVAQSMLSDIENGKKSTKREHVERIDAALNASGVLLRLWDGLFSPNGLPDYFRNVAQLERDAAEIRDYDSMMVPGLVQTDAYARTAIRIGQPTYTDAEVEQQVKARIDRQSILRAERPPLCIFVLEESVLHRPIGGHGIMKAQIEHLVEASTWPNVTLQVVPMAAVHHPGLDGTFRLLTVPENGQVLYTETRDSGYPRDEQTAVSDYTRVFGELRGAGLPAEDSRDLMVKVLGEYQND